MKNITLLITFLLLAHFSKAQNTCEEALPITTAGTFVVDAINGTGIPASNCVLNNTGVTAAEWYAYTPSQNYTATVTSDLQVNICKDTRLRIYTGSCAQLNCITGDDDAGVLPCNSGNTNSYLSTATFNVTAGTTYYIIWDNRWSSTGFTFQVIENPIVVPPPTPISYTNQTISTINSSYNKCVVDMNGDNLDDIVGVSANNLRVHFQNPNGTFTVSDFPITGTSKMPTWSIAAGDYNKDGFVDLLLGNGSGTTFWKSNSTGSSYSSINPSQYIFSQRTNFIDINNDGHLDAFVCHDVAPNVYFLNDGNGNLTYYQSGVTPGALNLGVLSSGGNYASLWFDYDNDGDRDLFISKCSGPPSELHRNDGNSVFTDISAIAQVNFTPVQSWSSAIADFDNDGDMDILVGSNGSAKSRLLKNNLDTTNNVEEPFTNISAGSGWDVDASINRDYVAYDFDNDGKVDVLGGGNKIMFNQGNNVFAPVSYASLGVTAIGDLNNDGFLDFQSGSTIRYAVPNGNNWLKIALKGIQSNGNGIGARVEILGSWGKQIRDARSGEGFAFMSSLNIHFGLGTATTIDQVIIRWPSGVVDNYYNVPINTTLNSIEGASLSTTNVSNTSFNVYPNPTKGQVFIQQNSAAQNTLSKVEIYDLKGALLIQKDMTNEQTINVEKLAIGTYILLLIDSDFNKTTQKIIKE
jgi:hypothetical protein